MLGIGANRPDGPEAIAWKQNQDFESVLKRLNQESESSSASPPEEAEMTPSEDTEEVADERAKRKEEKRRRKEEKRARKEERAKKKLEKNEKVAAAPSEPSTSLATLQPAAGPKVVRMAHRARHRASKAMLSSATALAEVLGESSSAPTPRETSPPPPKPTLTPISDENIKTSTINMADYFRSKIQAKVKSTSATPAPEIRQHDDRTDEERPSIGIGAKGFLSFPSIQSSYGPASPVEVPSAQSRLEGEETVSQPVLAGEEVISKPAKEGKRSSKKKRGSSEAQDEEADEPRKRKKKRRD
ncbi:hypothetical protein FRC04_003660 [Tulasnella sp. 424]|nr:hypothetical protein FRC04_003660 [Tulasnella sp. 424]